MAFGAKFNKRGNAVVDTITILIIIIVFGMTAVFGSLVLDEVTTDFVADENSVAATNQLTKMNDNYIALFDNLFLFVWVLLIIFTLISAAMLDTRPIFFVVSIISLFALFVVTPILANAFDDIMLEDGISTYANQFTFTSWIMGHLLELIIVIVFLLVTVIYLRVKGFT